MKKLLLLALLFVGAGVSAQNLQFHYDFGRNLYDDLDKTADSDGRAPITTTVEMFRAEKIGIPVVGVIENMAWFTPRELPDNRYYLFGRGGARAFAERNDVPFLGEIPIVQSVMEGSEGGRPAAGTDPAVESRYRSIAEKVVENMTKTR